MNASAIVGIHRVSLSEDVTILDAGPVILEIEGVDPLHDALLDGRRLAAAYDSGTRRLTAAVDLARATGFHFLSLGTGRWFFATTDAKLRIEGVAEMLERIGTLGLAWRGPLFFTEQGAAVRDLRLDAAWLDNHVGEIRDSLEAVAADPLRTSVSGIKRSTKGVPAIGPSLSLFRRRPDLLEEHLGGPITVDGREWAPREIVVRNRRPTLDNVANRRATRLALLSLRMAQSLCEALLPGDKLASAGQHAAVIQEVSRLDPFASLARLDARPIPAGPSSAEVGDPRYRKVFDLVREIDDGRSWAPTAHVAPEFAYALLSDRVFQIYTSVMIAQALDAPMVREFSTDGPHFESDVFAVWCDVTPPAEVVRNWRDSSKRPSSLRPDVLVLHKTSERAAIIDAKYRRDASGSRASSDSLNEAQLYLQAYGVQRVGIAFPPLPNRPSKVEDVSGEGYTIREIPVAPDLWTSTYLADVIRPSVEFLLEGAQG